MNIGLIGSGGREHALCQKLSESRLVDKIFCFPGNAGTQIIANNVKADILNFDLILKLIRFYKIDIVIVGPEEPLVRGIVDFLKKNKVKVFGPNKFASKLEGSKSFVKNICKKNNIPTADFKVCRNKQDLKIFLKKSKFPIVAKADGLAAGKGVTICNTKQQLFKVSEEIFKGKFQTSKKIVVEEFLSGDELSYFLIVDKDNFRFFGSAQDHKKVREKDRGPNTGGMGAYSPSPLLNEKLEKKIIDRIVKPTLNALKKHNNFYTGFLYVGLMIKNGEPYLIEYNVRMGDPECQVIIPRLKSDLVRIFKDTINNNLKKTKIIWKKEKSMTIVLCSKGYPGNYKKNIKIKNLKSIKIDKNMRIYHAGTKLQNGHIISIGGRVLNITSIGKNFFEIRKKIIKILKKLNWKSGFYRKDIGWRIKK